MNDYDAGRLNLPFVGIATFGKRPYVQDWSKIEADVAVLGAPFDFGTQFRAGARFGPRSVREASTLFSFGHAGAYANAHVYTAREAQLAALMPEKAAADTGKFLLCPMPGLVKALFVTLGQEVKAGEPLAMVEAMKMENVLRAEKDVTIAKILAREGDSLAVDAVIMEFA